MARVEDPEVTDPRLRDAAGLLKGLPAEAPVGSMAAQVVAQVKPVAARRRVLFAAITAAALLSAVLFAVMFFNALGTGEGP